MRYSEFILVEGVVRPEVKALQQMLKDRGYDLGDYGPNKDGVDGIMGPYTKTALAAYQKKIKPTAVPKPNKTGLLKQKCLETL